MIRTSTAFAACLALVVVSAVRAQSPAEVRAARAYDAAVQGGPLALDAFLDQFPKGADLHVHLSGAVYAETFIKDAGEDGLCVDPHALALTKPPCAPPLVPAAELAGVLTPEQQDLYDRLIDAFSMRSYVPTAGFSGHDQFFATFSRFEGLSTRHVGEWVDEVAGRSAAQNQQYLELMETPPFGHAAGLAQQIPLNGMDFAAYREELLAAGLKDEVAADREHVRTAEARRREIEAMADEQPTEIAEMLRLWMSAPSGGSRR